jgi:polyhydroxyalkanoate synthesis regulator phasin
MIDFMKKYMMLGIGLAVKTKEEIEKLAKDAVKQGKMSETEGRKFMDDMFKRYDESKKVLEEKVDKLVEKSMKKAGLARQSEVEDLKKEIEALKEKLKEKAS